MTVPRLQEAALAYDAAARRIRGASAVVNFDAQETGGFARVDGGALCFLLVRVFCLGGRVGPTPTLSPSAFPITSVMLKEAVGIPAPSPSPITAASLSSLLHPSLPSLLHPVCPIPAAAELVRLYGAPTLPEDAVHLTAAGSTSNSGVEGTSAPSDTRCAGVVLQHPKK